MRAATVVQVLQDFEVPATIAPRPPTTVVNSRIDRFLGSKETNIQSHNRIPVHLHGCHLADDIQRVSDSGRRPLCAATDRQGTLRPAYCSMHTQRTLQQASNTKKHNRT